MPESFSPSKSWEPSTARAQRVPDSRPEPEVFSIPDPYPICFQNHRVFRVSGISENYIFDMENVVKELQDIN